MDAWYRGAARESRLGRLIGICKNRGAGEAAEVSLRRRNLADIAYAKEWRRSISAVQPVRSDKDRFHYIHWPAQAQSLGEIGLLELEKKTGVTESSDTAALGVFSNENHSDHCTRLA